MATMPTIARARVPHDQPSQPYQRRRPERSVLYAVVREHVPSLQRDADERFPYGYPRHIEKTFRAYLRCGVLSHGLVRVRCAACGGESLVASSCKRRGVSFHISKAIPAARRDCLARLLRYGARPPFASSRLPIKPSGKVVYELRHPSYTGQTHVALDPVAFLRRLAALMPPPRRAHAAAPRAHAALLWRLCPASCVAY